MSLPPLHAYLPIHIPSPFLSLLVDVIIMTADAAHEAADEAADEAANVRSGAVFALSDLLAFYISG